MTARKVLHILTRLVKGGADENTLLTIEGLIRNDYRVDLVVGGDSDLSLVEELKDLNIIIIPELRRDIKFSNLIALWKLYRLILRNKYYVVHTHTAMAGFLGRVAARLARTPIVIHSLHGITFHKNLNKARKKLYVYLEILTGYWTDYFITVGEDIKQKYLAESIGKKEKYKVIRSGFDYDDFYNALNCYKDLKQRFNEKYNVDASNILIGTVSRIEPRKGHIYLIEAAQKVVNVIPKAKFIIIGEGYYKQELEKKVNSLGLQKNIFFIGHRDKIADTMVCLDIVVLTSLWEGLPRVLVQAALLGKPIVTFDVEGANEIIKDNVNGFIVPTKDKDILADRLIYLAKNPAVITEFGGKSSLQINGLWKKEVMIEEINKVYENLISRKVFLE